VHRLLLPPGVLLLQLLLAGAGSCHQKWSQALLLGSCTWLAGY
jgi:hypothetical protein